MGVTPLMTTLTMSALVQPCGVAVVTVTTPVSHERLVLTTGIAAISCRSAGLVSVETMPASSDVPPCEMSAPRCWRLFGRGAVVTDVLTVTIGVVAMTETLSYALDRRGAVRRYTAPL